MTGQSTVDSKRLTSGRVLARNTVYNLFGQCAPMLVAIFSIPLLIKGLGTDRFGILSLAWMIIGYSCLFDMGLSRALIKLIAEKLGEGKDAEIPSLVWTALFIMTIIGIVVAILVSLISSLLVHNILKIPVLLQNETLSSFYLLAFSIPVVIATSGFRGILEAHQRFGLINAVRLPMGVFTFLGPLLVLLFSNSLFHVIAVLTIGRVIALLVHAQLCFNIIPLLKRNFSVNKNIIKRLVSFGGWLTIANIANPLMLTFDRFFIGAILSTTFVSYYSTPSELITKVWLIPSAMVGVLFPAFTTTFISDRSRTRLLFDKSIKFITLIVFPISLVMIVFANDILLFWLGLEFASNSTLILQVLSIGVFICSLAHFPAEILNCAGLPDLTAKLRLIELPIYASVLYYSTYKYGILGCALVWVIRLAVDSFVLFYVAFKVLHYEYDYVFKICLQAIALIIALILPIFIPLLIYKSVYLLIVTVASCYYILKNKTLETEFKFILEYIR
ncbi:MAG: flippase [Desulfuromonadales bacterium]|nr:flippase [Desulfuromonadales bacterium]